MHTKFLQPQEHKSVHASRLLGLFFFFHSLLEISEKGFHHILCLKRFTGSVSDGSSKATSNLDEFGIALILTPLVTFNDTPFFKTTYDTSQLSQTGFFTPFLCR